jgi:phosphoglycolate phosphatase
MKDRFDLLIFDWDGTLFDSIEFIVDCLRQAALENGLPVPSGHDARSVIGLSLKHAMEALFPGVEDAALSGLMTSYYARYSHKIPGPHCLFPGVEAMLRRLRERGYLLAVATGKGRRALEHVVAATETADVFHALRSAEETASKPDPRMLLEILEELDIAPERALMVGDSVHDLHMARNACVHAAAVSCGANAREELLALVPLVCLERTTELLELLV